MCILREQRVNGLQQLLSVPTSVHLTDVLVIVHAYALIIEMCVHSATLHIRPMAAQLVNVMFAFQSF